MQSIIINNHIIVIVDQNSNEPKTRVHKQVTQGGQLGSERIIPLHSLLKCEGLHGSN